MRTLRYYIQSIAMAIALLYAPAAIAQGFITKSGTAVYPAPHSTSFQQTPSKGFLRPSSYAGQYYIVAPQEFIPHLQQFIRWKRQEGYSVRLITPHVVQRDSIRAALSELYASLSDPLTYILLVGDIDRIPSFPGRHTPSGLSTQLTDLYYAEYNGDFIPEAMLGRLSVADTLQLTAVLNKIIAYEQGRYATQLSQFLLVAGAEDRSPAPTTTNGQVNYLSTLVAEHHPETDTICFRNPTSSALRDSIIAAALQPNVAINYTAHCTQSGWTNPAFSIPLADSLPMPFPTLYINNCCRSNAFGSDCFGEHLLRKPLGGAVGVIGASNETLWAEDYYWAVGAKYPLSLQPDFIPSLPGAFDQFIADTPEASTPDSPPYTLGAMLHKGCNAVATAGSPFDAYYWEIYCLLGDPSMIPYWPNPDTLSLLTPDSIMAGTTTLPIISSSASRLTVIADTTILATTISHNDDTTTLSLCKAIDADSITLTITCPKALSLSRTIPVFHPRKPFLALVDSHADSTSLFLRIKNVGLFPALGHTLTLTQDSPDGLQLTTPFTLTIPFLDALADTLISFSLSDCIPGIEPLFSAILTFTDSLGETYSTLHLNTPLPDTRPQLLQIAILLPDSSQALQLLPNNEYVLKARFSHSPQSLSVTLQDTLLPLTSDGTTFSVPFRTPENIGHLCLTLTPSLGNWSHTHTYWLTAYQTLEPFEDGNFSVLPWQHPTIYPWISDTLASHSGLRCARSSPVGDHQQSTLSLDILTLVDDSISFFYNVSSESSDWLNFYIDGRRRGFWSGNTGWQYYSRLLPAGQHRLQWVYQKDISTSQLDDCARIDDLRLPLALWSQPAGIPTPDTTHSSIPSQPQPTHLLFSLSPNPARDVITISLPDSPKSCSISFFDNLGRHVDKIILPPHTPSTQYSTLHLRLGTYTAVLHHPAGTAIKKMIVIR